MKRLVRLVDRVSAWYREQRDKYDRRLQSELVEEVELPSASKNLANRALATQLRNAGGLYHMACNAWLEANPGRSIRDFDMLPLATKEAWMTQVQNA